MRTIEDLKLAIAILAENISTTKPYHRLVSSTYVFTIWQTAPSGAFVTALINKIEHPAKQARLASLRNRCTQTALLSPSESVKQMLDAHSLSDGAIRLLVKQTAFRGLIKRSTIPPEDRVHHGKGNRNSENGRWYLQAPGDPPPRRSASTTIIGSQRRRPGEPDGPSSPLPREAREPGRITHTPISGRSSREQTHIPDSISAAELALKGSEFHTEHFTRHLLHFGTDRLMVLDNNAAADFGDQRGNDEVSYGVASVSVPHVHAEGRIERPTRGIRFWRTLEEDPSSHIVIHNITSLDLNNWVRNAKKADEGLLFIHGFNVSFDEALWRTAQICHDLKFPGVKLCYSWASCGKLQSYPADEATVDWSESHLRSFLTEVTSKLGLSRLHIIAHSMGNRALLGVLESWENTPGTTPISQIVLAAPDIDAGRFRQIARVFKKYEQVTLYASTKDRAINLSKALRKLARAGDASPPIVMPDLSTVDVSAAGAEIFGLGHSYFATSTKVFRDLYYIIRERFPPDRRAGIKITDLGHYELM